MRSLQKATHHQTRLINQQLVLRTLYDQTAVTRAEVARLTGLTRTTVSDVVDGRAPFPGRLPVGTSR